MSRHPFDTDCNCARCLKELRRRTAQSARDPRTLTHATRKRFARIRETRRPIVGSAEWAETRGDDLGYSGDY
jgi:hypothetical protein